jgi:phospholipid/cholesterol/gamma-HCH transport system substrate-binding protein
MKTTAALVKLIVFMIVTSILTLFLAATIGNITFGGKTTYKAMFSDVTGLLAGNDVRLAGVRVGQVTGIELADRKLARVTFTLDQNRRIPESTILRLRYRNLVGERYLAVTEGPGSADLLKSGSTVPLTQTRNALDLTVLFNGFRPLFQALDPQSTNEVAYELIQTLQGEGGTLEALMQRTASLRCSPTSAGRCATTSRSSGRWPAPSTPTRPRSTVCCSGCPPSSTGSSAQRPTGRGSTSTSAGSTAASCCRRAPS